MPNYLTLSEAVRFFPRRNGKSISSRTVYMRATRGVRGVVLQTIREGNMLMTTEEWIEQFQRECTAKARRDVNPYDRPKFQADMDDELTRRLARRDGKEEKPINAEMYAVR